MGQKVEVKMHCSSGRGDFIAIFEETNPEKWVAMEAKLIPPPQKQSFLERVGNFISSSGQSFGSQGSYTPFITQSQVQMKGSFYNGDMKCPFCGKNSFVKCGRCGELSCHRSGDNSFKCPCGNSGTISGTISDMEGQTNNERRDNGGSSRQNSNTIDRKTTPRQDIPQKKGPSNTLR